MSNQTGSITVKLDYLVNEDSKVVSLSHPFLSGVLGFEFTSVDLAKIQLNAIDVNKPKTELEKFLQDTEEMFSLADSLKSAVKNMRS